MSSLEPLARPAEPTVPAGIAVRSHKVPVAKATQVKLRAGTLLKRTGPMLLYRLNRIGPTGATGAAMALFAAIFFFSSILPQQRELTALQLQIEQAHRSAKGLESAPVRLSRFMSSLPRRSELPVIVGQVFTLAGAAHVTLEQGRYELNPMRAGHLAQYRMTFPIKGEYPDIRRFIDTVLTTIPSVAVEGMRIERKTVGEQTVNADLRLSVFVRNDS